MSNLKAHSQGTFCWPELGTTDGPAAVKFYSSLFGLTIKDASPSPEMKYWILQKNDKDAAAVYTHGTQQAGMPSAWLTYVAVQSVKDTTRKCEALGGKVVMGNIDVMDLGKLSVLQDPQGAFFAIWEAVNHPGIGVAGEEGTMCWCELSTSDTAGARKFYCELIGWTTKPSGNPEMEYIEWQNNGSEIGGMMPLQPGMEGVPPHWLIYFMVANVDASAARAEQLGGKICVPPMDIPNVGRFSVIFDPTGAAFAIFTLAHHP